MFAFISEFLFLIVGVVFIIISCVYNDSKSFYPSSVTLLVSVAALGMYYQADVLTLIEQYGTFKAIVTLTSIYILMGLITSLVYWMFYINKKLRSILPPKFSDCHPFIVGAGLSWPITLFWMLLSKIIKNGLKTILNLFEGTFNMVSARLFGKI